MAGADFLSPEALHVVLAEIHVQQNLLPCPSHISIRSGRAKEPAHALACRSGPADLGLPIWAKVSTTFHATRPAKPLPKAGLPWPSTGAAEASANDPDSVSLSRRLKELRWTARRVRTSGVPL